MYFFVAKLLYIAVITYSCVSSPREPTSHRDRLISYAHSEYTSAYDGSTCAWHATPLSFEVSFSLRIPA